VYVAKSAMSTAKSESLAGTRLCTRDLDSVEIVPFFVDGVAGQVPCKEDDGQAHDGLQ